MSINFEAIASPGYTPDSWHYDTQTMTIDHDSGGYWIDLRRCNSAAAILDWIMQISGKAWCSNESLGQLVRLLDEALDPQGSFCSFAMDYNTDRGDGLKTALALLVRKGRT